MKQGWVVGKREFRGYFDHPTAYILVVAFLALALFFTFRSLYASGVASMRGLFSLLPWLFAVFVPAITMRSFAEERRSGTLEWLVSQPVTELDVLIGKFLGNWSFALAAIVGTIPAAFGVLLLSEADPGILVAQYVGAALFAGQLVAVGLFASAITSNQITAFILSVATNFALILAGLPVVLMGLPPVLADAVTQLAVMTHFEGIERGVLDLRDLLYFVTSAGLFLALGYLFLIRGRLSATRGAYRRLRAGIAGIAIGVLVLNLLGARIHGRLDLTADDLYTLSPGTQRVLESLDDVVTIRLVVSRELPPEIGLTLRDVRDLLADYQRSSGGRLHVSELNPDRGEEEEQEASSLGVQPIQFNVLRGDDFELRRGWFGLAVMYADEREIIPIIDRTDDLEYRLTTLIAGLTRETTPRLALVGGAGSIPPTQFSTFQQAMRQQYAIESVDLQQPEEAAPQDEAAETDSLTPAPQDDAGPSLSPDSFDVAIVVSGQAPFDESAVGKIRSFVDGGGSAFLLLNGNGIDQRMGLSRPLTTGLESLLEEYGVRLGNGMVYDLRSNQQVSLGQQGIFPVVASYPLWPVALPVAEHVVTRGLEALTLAWATPLEIVDSATANVVQPLWGTTELAGRRPAGSPITPETQIEPSREELSEQILAVAVDSGDEEEGSPSERGRLVVVGNSEFLTDNFAQGSPQNVVFAANAVDWLAQDETLIGIRSKDRTPPPLLFESEFGQAAFKWGNLIGIPLLFVAFGAVRVAQRRRLSDRTWSSGAFPRGG